MEFGVLGPLRATFDGREVPIGGPRQRTVLAMLLLAHSQVVSVDRLMDVVWDGCPPATARTQVAICVAGLRKAFKAMGYPHDVIVTTHPGYLLRTEDCQLDVTDFTATISRAQGVAREGRVRDAEALYLRALGLWRGPALEGVTGRPLEDEAARLEERRFAARDEWTALRLELGHDQELIPELYDTVRDHPLRERPRLHLMLAQYRAGRRVEALEVFDDGRRRFTDVLGIEPGPGLRRLQTAILRDDPDLLPFADAGEADEANVVPAQLPSPPRVFIGRQEELTALDALLHDGAEQRGTRSAMVGWITGATGSGKTAFAVHWAHRHAAAFPDGQLYAHLGGSEEGEPARSADVLEGFLRALGVPNEQIPADPSERGALYRSVLASRRMLLVLDDAWSFRQIRPLLPGGGRCRVLVTGRGRGEGLAMVCDAVALSLGPLGQGEAVRLLGELAGPQRVAAEAAHAERLARLCDRLPLVLSIAAGRLVCRPHWTLAQLTSRLLDERRRLDELSQGDVDLRAVLTADYCRLPESARALYRRLGLLGTEDFTARTGAALADTSEDEAECEMEHLVDLQFLTVAGIGADGRPRYAFPFSRLMRPHARERAEAEDDAEERRRALGRGRAARAESAEADPLGGGQGDAEPARADGRRRGSASCLPSPRSTAWRRGTALRGR
ncbi:BTAD domain-containing putative transcriptional regulator [Streptomyces sp. NPDC093097]|uniref:AfsR/SARP family transcriptional regulator n=1 Tax=Streptomyces sp. NPDC093097 TaxID=3366027 RepID=UPI00381F79C6